MFARYYASMDEMKEQALDGNCCSLQPSLEGTRTEGVSPVDGGLQMWTVPVSTSSPSPAGRGGGQRRIRPKRARPVAVRLRHFSHWGKRTIRNWSPSACFSLCSARVSRDLGQHLIHEDVMVQHRHFREDLALER